MTAQQTPSRALPLLYLGTAHAALILACAVTGWWPQSVAGFFYHAWILGIVHLVTLGWITFSILGAMYIAAPVALRVELPVRRWDYAAYACALIGLVGMVGHFWIQEYGGMAWSAGTIAVGVAFVTVRIGRAVARARIQTSIKLFVLLACANFWVAAAMGVLVALDKVLHFLPGFVLSNVLAHAHLAAIGWAAMMVAGLGFRVLPAGGPSETPSEGRLYWSAFLLEAGVLGLFHTLLAGSRWALGFGTLIAAGLAVLAITMMGTLRARPPAAPRPDFAVLHAAGAGVSLAAALALGLALLAVPQSAATLRAGAAYGVLGIVGFLGQFMVALEARRGTHDRALQSIVFACWSIGVPALALGVFDESARLVGAGAWSLFAGASIGTLDGVFASAPRTGAQKREI